jgi:hypothetical protein
MSLRLVPISLREANAYVDAHHRHHKSVVGHKFSIGCEKDGQLAGVAIVGRPVSRYLDDGTTLEVTRLCSSGEKNVCSFLYGAAARAAKALGYRKIITYTLDTEPGISLRAAGWTCAGKAGGIRWTGKRRPAVDLCPPQMKLRYEKTL